MNDIANAAVTATALASGSAAAEAHHQGHDVSAVFSSRADAQAARLELIQQGIAADAVSVATDPCLSSLEHGSEEDERDYRDEMRRAALTDGAIGAVAGNCLAGLGLLAMAGGDIAAITDNSAVAFLFMLAWVATAIAIGAVVGGAAGFLFARDGVYRGSRLVQLVKGAIKAGNTVLVAHTHGDVEKDLAKNIIGHSLKTRDTILA